MGRWNFDEKNILQFAYNCERCKEKKLKKRLGCRRTYKRKHAGKIECICGGNSMCEICKGENSFKIYTCPRNILSDACLLRILPYFYDYVYQGWNYPCGSRYETPKLLIQAFDILLTVYNIERAKTIPKDE